LQAKALTIPLPARAFRLLPWREGTHQAHASRFAAVRVRCAMRDYWRMAYINTGPMFRSMTSIPIDCNMPGTAFRGIAMRWDYMGGAAPAKTAAPVPASLSLLMSWLINTILLL
jgi:hypothetical protein